MPGFGILDWLFGRTASSRSIQSQNVRPSTRLSAQPVAPEKDTILSDGYAPPYRADDLDDFGCETDAMRQAYLRLFREEPSLKSAVEGKAESIASLDVMVKPCDDTKPDDVRAAKFVEWAIKATPHGFDGLFLNVLKPAFLLGWSCQEIVLRHVDRDESAEWGGFVGLRHCRSLNTAKLRLQLDAYRNVLGVVNTVRGLASYPRRKVLLYTHNELFHNPFGGADAATAYRDASVIDAAFKLWGFALKVYGGPFLKGTYSAKDTRKMMERALDAARQGGWITLPKGDDVEVINLATATSFAAFQEKVKKHEERVYTAVRGAYLPYMQGGASGGETRGSAETSKSAGSDPKEYLVGVSVCRAINRDVVPHLVTPNFPAGTGMPEVVLGGVNWGETRIQLDVAKALNELVKAQGRMVKADYLSKVTGMPLEAVQVEMGAWPPAGGAGAAVTTAGVGGSGGLPPGGAGHGGTGGAPAVLPPGPPAGSGSGAGAGTQTAAPAPAPTPTPTPTTPPSGQPQRPDGTPTSPDPQRVYSVPPGSIASDPARFQFKVSGIGSDGVSDKFKGETTFDPQRAGTLLVWRDPADGRDYVVDGHHRLELAKRTNAPVVYVRYIQAATAEDARDRGAMANLAKGTATRADMANALQAAGPPGTPSENQDFAPPEWWGDEPDADPDGEPAWPGDDEAPPDAPDPATFSDSGPPASGERKDSLGRRMCFQDGKRVRCAPKPGEGHDPSKPHPSARFQDNAEHPPYQGTGEAWDRPTWHPAGKTRDGRLRWMHGESGRVATGDRPAEPSPQRKQAAFAERERRLRQPATVYPVPDSLRGAVTTAFGDRDKEGVLDVLGLTNGSAVALQPSWFGGNSVGVSIAHPDVDQWSRTIVSNADGTLTVKNNLFFLKPGARGGGFGTKAFAGQVQGMVREGGKEIVTTAGKGGAGGDKMNGYYTWPRLGYDAELEPEYRRKLPEQFRNARTVQDLMATREGAEHWKRTGYMTQMKFDTTPGSRSIQVLNRYLASKGEPPIDDGEGVAKARAEKIEQRRERVATPPAAPPTPPQPVLAPPPPPPVSPPVSVPDAGESQARAEAFRRFAQDPDAQQAEREGREIARLLGLNPDAVSEAVASKHLPAAFERAAPAMTLGYFRALVAAGMDPAAYPTLRARASPGSTQRPAVDSSA